MKRHYLGKGDDRAACGIAADTLEGLDDAVTADLDEATCRSCIRAKVSELAIEALADAYKVLSPARSRRPGEWIQRAHLARALPARLEVILAKLAISRKIV